MTSTAHVDKIVHGKIVEIDLHGKLNRQDYEDIGPSIENLIRKHGKIRVIVTMHEFDGWDAGALWEDIKWEAKHFSDIDRLAIVGEERWQKWMAGICHAFTTADVRYFRLDRLDDAYAWLRE